MDGGGGGGEGGGVTNSSSMPRSTTRRSEPPQPQRSVMSCSGSCCAIAALMWVVEMHVEPSTGVEVSDGVQPVASEARTESGKTRTPFEFPAPSKPICSPRLISAESLEEPREAFAVT